MSACPRCGAHHQLPGGTFHATYNAPDNTDYCCAWCANGTGCLCSVWTTTPTTPRLDALLHRLEGTNP